MVLLHSEQPRRGVQQVRFQSRAENRSQIYLFFFSRQTAKHKRSTGGFRTDSSPELVVLPEHKVDTSRPVVGGGGSKRPIASGWVEYKLLARKASYSRWGLARKAPGGRGLDVA